MPWFHIQDPYYKHWPGIHGICRTIHVVLFAELFLTPPPSKKKKGHCNNTGFLTPHQRVSRQHNTSTKQLRKPGICHKWHSNPAATKIKMFKPWNLWMLSGCLFRNRFFHKQWWWCWENICLGGNISGIFFGGMAFLNQKIASFNLRQGPSLIHIIYMVM